MDVVGVPAGIATSSYIVFYILYVHGTNAARNWQMSGRGQRDVHIAISEGETVATHKKKPSSLVFKEWEDVYPEGMDDQYLVLCGSMGEDPGRKWLSLHYGFRICSKTGIHQGT